MAERDNEIEQLKEVIKNELKKELRKELLQEIYQELKQEELSNEKIADETENEDGNNSIYETNGKNQSKPDSSTVSAEEEQMLKKIISETKKIKKAPKSEIIITIPSFLKMASHALKYANEHIPKDKWVEVIGLLAGRLKKTEDGEKLFIEDAYPMGHGNAVYAEIKDYKNFITAFDDLKRKGLFICGWYHSHPTYGLFLSNEDMGTQARYQRLWKDSVALVIDPYMIDGTSFGFNIFRADLKKYKWFPVPFSFKEDINPATLPELLRFINPIIDGKPLFFEYDG